jgi:hypothetical protein
MTDYAQKLTLQFGNAESDSDDKLKVVNFA